MFVPWPACEAQSRSANFLQMMKDPLPALFLQESFPKTSSKWPHILKVFDSVKKVVL